MSTDDTTQRLPSSGDEPLSTPAGAPAGTPGLFPDVTPTSTPVDAPVISPAERPRPRLRVSTAVWGLVIAAIGVGVVALASGAVFDLQLALIALLAVAGVAMLGGSIAAAARHRGP
ncbi:MAG TPA: hypothetical protein VIK17_04585 [Cellulomonas sp.]